MAIAVIGVFATGHANGLLPVALALGIACNLEGLAMSVVQPVWRREVKWIGEAWRIRGEILCGKGGSSVARQAVGRLKVASNRTCRKHRFSPASAGIEATITTRSIHSLLIIPLHLEIGDSPNESKMLLWVNRILFFVKSQRHREELVRISG